MIVYVFLQTVNTVYTVLTILFTCFTIVHVSSSNYIIALEAIKMIHGQAQRVFCHVFSLFSECHSSIDNLIMQDPIFSKEVCSHSFKKIVEVPSSKNYWLLYFYSPPPSASLLLPSDAPFIKGRTDGDEDAQLNLGVLIQVTIPPYCTVLLSK